MRHVLVHDYNTILEDDPEVEIVIEVMGGLKTSIRFCE